MIKRREALTYEVSLSLVTIIEFFDEETKFEKVGVGDSISLLKC